MSEAPADPPPEIPSPPLEAHELTVDVGEATAYDGAVVYKRKPDGSLELA
ncbi:MAG TPA: hypothetical protein VGF17_03100 [Phytomonospora sp.]